MSIRRSPAPSVPATGCRMPFPFPDLARSDRAEAGRSGIHRARPGQRLGFFAGTEADPDGGTTDELVRTVGLRAGSCTSDAELAFLARELAEHVERRDARMAIEELRRRLDVLDENHPAAVGQVVRASR